MFDDLNKSSCKYFLTNFKQANRDWINEPETFYCPQSMIDLTNIYMNCTSIVYWNKDDEYREANIIALATALHYERMKNNNCSKKSSAPGVHPGLEL